MWIDLKTKNPFLIILLNEYILDSEVMKIINMSIERKSEQKQNLGQLEYNKSHMKLHVVANSFTGDSQRK